MEIRDDVELGTIARDIYIEAAPETVFEVVSRPEHVAQWWSDAADYDVVAGSEGELVFANADGDKHVVLTVLEVNPPTTFSFRWTHAAGQDPQAGNSLLVTFEVLASGTGSLLRFSETGFRSMGWQAEEFDSVYFDHVAGWNHFLAGLAPYAESAGSRV